MAKLTMTGHVTSNGVLTTLLLPPSLRAALVALAFRDEASLSETMRKYLAAAVSREVDDGQQSR
jgi:hypothetical protein